MVTIYFIILQFIFVTYYGNKFLQTLLFFVTITVTPPYFRHMSKIYVYFVTYYGNKILKSAKKSALLVVKLSSQIIFKFKIKCDDNLTLGQKKNFFLIIFRKHWEGTQLASRSLRFLNITHTK
jgi:hypothetical protein